jgi:SPP1 gp7 family putative phage head morphogenesis protein
MVVRIMPGIITKILDFFGISNNTVEAPVASYAESPATYIYDQFKLATDRVAVVRDVQKLVGNDLRFKMTNLRLSSDAARGGFKVVVHGSEAYRQTRRKQGKSIPKRLTPGANIAQQVIDDLLKRSKLPSKAKGHIRTLLRDGDIFLNPIVDINAGLILDVRQAPVLTIKRNSDEYGDFPDPEKAFSQIDPRTQIHSLMEIGPPSDFRTHFALYQINHIRWLWEETENYGTSHYKSARNLFNILQKMEIATAIRREFRSVKKRNHKLPENTQPTQVKEYMRDVGLIDVNGNPTKNAHLLSDFVGTAEVTSLNDTNNLNEIDDVKYFEELLWFNLGVPKAILTAGADINRDVLKVQYPHYLETLEDVTDVLEYGDPGAFSGLRDIIDLQLLLAGINPDALNYDVVWSDKSGENGNERMDRVQKALGANKGVKIITREKAIQEIADDFDIEDPTEMARLVEEEEARERTMLAAETPPEPNERQGKAEEEESVEDVLLEGRPTTEDLEKKAQASVLRFFNAVYRRMLNYSQPVIDSTIIDFSEESILTILEDSWDSEESKYQVSIVNQMTAAGVIGAARAVVKVAEKRQQVTGEVKIQPKITKQDIHDDLLAQSGQRIKGIKDTLKQIREALAEGFSQDFGWKNIMKQLQPIIVSDVRAEMIARTELSWAYNRSAKRVYQEAGFENVEWSAVIDHRACPICQDRHGKIYPIDEHPDIPAHPRCRCSLLPAD